VGTITLVGMVLGAAAGLGFTTLETARWIIWIMQESLLETTTP
jgi:RsiW-degrading membrane proteinase PrsW (M82 family)